MVEASSWIRRCHSATGDRRPADLHTQLHVGAGMQTPEGDKSCGRLVDYLPPTGLRGAVSHQLASNYFDGNCRTGGYKQNDARPGHGPTQKNWWRLSVPALCAPRSKQWSWRLVSAAAGRAADVNVFLGLQAAFTFLLLTHLQLLA